MTTSTAAGKKPSPRLKGMTILAVLALSALVFLAWSQQWGSLLVSGTSVDGQLFSIPGSVAAPALAALGLAGLALAAALAIAGPVVRVILGALQIAVGVAITASSIGAILDPIAAGSPVVTKATGIAGLGAIRSISTDAGESPWGFLALALGILIALTGLFIILSTKRWPVSGRRYQAVRFEAVDVASRAAEKDGPETNGPEDAVDTQATERSQAIDNWDSLSNGRDPTA
jgi:uncharacterized membrane protein YjgN (DUF898 family)